jgi:hypothetical protein
MSICVWPSCGLSAAHHLARARENERKWKCSARKSLVVVALCGCETMKMLLTTTTTTRVVKTTTAEALAVIVSPLDLLVDCSASDSRRSLASWNFGWRRGGLNLSVRHDHVPERLLFITFSLDQDAGGLFGGYEWLMSGIAFWASKVPTSTPRRYLHSGQRSTVDTEYTRLADAVGKTCRGYPALSSCFETYF